MLTLFECLEQLPGFKMEDLQNLIAAGKIAAKIKLENCILIPVQQTISSLAYFRTQFSSFDDIKIQSIHQQNPMSEHFNQFMLSCWINNDLIAQNEKVSAETLWWHMVKKGAFDSCNVEPQFSVLDTCKYWDYIIEEDNSQNTIPVLEVNCAVAVSPYYVDKEFEISFSSAKSIEEFKEYGQFNQINLSCKNRHLQKQLPVSSIVEFNKELFYVSNHASFEINGKKHDGYALSSDVWQSYNQGNGVVILKEDLEKFQQSMLETSKSENLDKSSPIFGDLLFYNEIIEKFDKCKVHSNYKNFLIHQNKGVKGEDAFDIQDIENWILNEINKAPAKLGYNFTPRCAELVKKMIVKKYNIKKDKRQIKKKSS